MLIHELIGSSFRTSSPNLGGWGGTSGPTAKPPHFQARFHSVTPANYALGVPEGDSGSLGVESSKRCCCM